MARYSLEKFQEKLDRNINWRKRELTTIKANIIFAKGPALITAIRSGITLLYAHWEGFIKNAAREYLKFLNKQNLKCCELKDNFLVLHMKKSIIDTRQSNKTKKHAFLINKLLYQSDDYFKVDVLDTLIIDTESNLSYDVLKDILYGLNIDERDFELKQHFIKDNLLDKRNKIAHGEYVRILENNLQAEKKAKEEFEILYQEILGLMEKFKDNILDSAIEKKYLKNI